MQGQTHPVRISERVLAFKCVNTSALSWQREFESAWTPSSVCHWHVEGWEDTFDYRHIMVIIACCQHRHISYARRHCAWPGNHCSVGFHRQVKTCTGCNHYDVRQTSGNICLNRTIETPREDRAIFLQSQCVIPTCRN